MASDAAPAPPALPELACVPWRPRVTARSLSRTGWLWTLSAAAHTIPLVGAGVGLALLNPITIPVGLILIVHAWVIPELYAARGAKVVLRPRPGRGDPAGPAGPDAERLSIGLLGDLVGHRARAIHAQTGLVTERGALGVWVVGEAGALLVRLGGRRVDCFCVRVTDPSLPGGDRIAHLLLALRADEAGFATVANLAFSGARWRVRRRLESRARAALDEAAALASAA